MPVRPLTGAAFALAVALAFAKVAAASAASAPPRDDLSAADAARVVAVTAPPADFGRPEAFEARGGGATTTGVASGREAFSQPAANLSFEDQQRFRVGNGVFRKLWASSPSSTRASDGLGPLYNARGCQSCHLKDGRGRAVRPDAADTFLMRLSVPAPDGGDAPEPVYGSQLQDVAVPGVLAEGRVRVSWTDLPVTLADGTVVTLRRPAYRIEDLGYGPMRPDTRMSPRVASQMIGLGLLEAIHTADILARADPDDDDGDGISGRPNRVVDGTTGETVVGRFGWKAGQPTVAQQSAHAFHGDMGLSTPLLASAAGECTPAQDACLAMPAGDDPATGEPEVPAEVFDLVSFYARTLAVPVRRDVDAPEVLAGKRLFHDVGCASCHVPKFVTRRGNDIAALDFQLIWPYSDLLLHDMGEDLADGRPEAEASGREWRTAPLWGIGRTMDVSGHTELLHDGRARSVLEAILWHGGEAAAARDAVVALPAADRDALLAFVNSL
jgi:CxxC motif-containing protein (DUF1111 family)